MGGSTPPTGTRATRPQPDRAATRRKGTTQWTS
nr:MAG TPA: hypothetical protein [Caudoviricetes sp.]